MLPAVAYTLADFLDSGLPSITTESIRFEHPSFASTRYPSINLYLCDISRSSRSSCSSRNETGRSEMRWHSASRTERISSGLLTLAWFNASFLLTVQEHTQLGRQRLITAAMTHCLEHPYLSNHQLAPPLRGYGRLPLRTKLTTTSAYEGVEVPKQPGLHLTLTVPFEAIRATLPMRA